MGGDPNHSRQPVISLQKKRLPLLNRITYLDDQVPVSIGHEKRHVTPAEFRSGLWLRYHADVECQFIIQGKGAYFIDGHEYQFERDSFLIMFPNNPHFFKSEHNCRIEKISLVFRRKYIAEILGKIKFFKDMPHYIKLNQNESSTVRMLLNKIMKEQQQRQIFWAESMQAKLGELFILIKRASQRPQLQLKTNPLVTQMLGWIEGHFLNSFSVAAMAAHFGYSADYLTRCFKQSSGIGIKHYILQRRIVEAKKILESRPEIKIDSIAESVGFSHFTVFNRAFKNIIGVTPSTYRGYYHPEVGN